MSAVVAPLIATGPVLPPMVAEISAGGFSGGAMVGAVGLGVLILTALAFLGRNVTAFCALVMIVSAGAALFFGGGVFAPVVSNATATLAALMEAIFAASAIIFLSSTLDLSRRNTLLSGIMFAAALSALGIGLANFVMDGAFAGAVRAIAIGGLGLSAVATLVGALRGDSGARLVLPGVVIAASVPVVITLFGGSMSFGGLGQIGFLLGAMAVGMVGSLDNALRQRLVNAHGEGDAFAGRGSSSSSSSYQSPSAAMAGIAASARAAGARDAGAGETLQNQLANVLDYAGIAAWDWQSGSGQQTPSFNEMMGADGDGVFTPDALREFVAEVSREVFERKVYGGGDGGFDELIELVGDRTVRMRGARAVGPDGALERIMVFLDEPVAPTKDQSLLKTAAASLAGTAAIGGARPAEDAAFIADVVAALDADDIGARFQPIVRLHDRQTIGYETLMYWPGAQAIHGDTLTADRIIGAARAGGRGPELTRRMVRLAAGKVADHIAKAKPARRSDNPVPFVAFNVTASEILSSGFADDVLTVMREFSLPRGALVLEVTETEKLSDRDRFEAVFGPLRDAGVMLAFDDFGAGFSCLANLHRFAFDFMKIDKSFVERMSDDAGAAKIVTALCGLARDLGMRVIAEGIEQRADAIAAEAAGCTLAQGYLFGVPEVDAEVDDTVRAAEPALAARASDTDGNGPAEGVPPVVSAPIAAAVGGATALASDDDRATFSWDDQKRKAADADDDRPVRNRMPSWRVNGFDGSRRAARADVERAARANVERAALSATASTASGDAPTDNAAAAPSRAHVSKPEALSRAGQTSGENDAGADKPEATSSAHAGHGDEPMTATRDALGSSSDDAQAMPGNGVDTGTGGHKKTDRQGAHSRLWRRRSY